MLQSLIWGKNNIVIKSMIDYTSSYSSLYFGRITLRLCEFKEFFTRRGPEYSFFPFCLITIVRICGVENCAVTLSAQWLVGSLFSGEERRWTLKHFRFRNEIAMLELIQLFVMCVESMTVYSSFTPSFSWLFTLNFSLLHFPH